MGVIEDVYEDLDTDVDLAEFEAAVHEKVEQMGGLADEETAAMLVAHELADDEVGGVADIEPGMDEVEFMAKVVSVGDLRTFERDGDDEDGRVVNAEVADETGRVRVAFWDEKADAAASELETGQVLRLKGRPKEGYDGVEVNVDRVEPDADAEIDVQVSDTYRVEDLALGRSDVNLRGRVLATDSVRTFQRDDGSEGRVANLSLGDETGRVRVTLWDDQVAYAEELEPGTSVEVVDGYVRERDGDLELHLGSRGTIEELDEAVEYVPETTDIDSLELGQTVDVAGGVIEVDPKRTFDRDDGSTGQVRNVRVRDDTGDIRVALWGEKADTDLDLGDYAVFTDVEIKDGWQDDLEASAGWRSTVTVMDDAPGGADAGAGAADPTAVTAGSDEIPATDPAGTGDAGEAEGLAAFAAGTSDGASGGTAATTAREANAGSGSGGTGTDPGADTTDGGAGTDVGGTDGGSGSGDAGTAAVEEFTGTVVQAGSPVVLDDGTETRSVETDADLRLGQEVTVRGPVEDGRIRADEVR